MIGPRVTVICGAYGAGKSECSIALARTLPAPVTLIDLDVVNPYFRSRQARQLLEGEGITVIGNSLRIDAGIDLPAIPGAVAPALSDSARRVVVDLGGDAAGARALRQFLPSLPVEATELVYVVNRFRPENRDAPRTRASLRAIEGEIGVACTGLISNSHMLHETREEHISAGLRLCRELSAETRIPVAYIAGDRTVLESWAATAATAVTAATSSEPHLYLTGVLREEWMNMRREPCHEDS